MKKIKALATTLAAIALLALLPETNALKADAAEAQNYAVKFCPNDNGGEWRYQEGSIFDDDKTDREIYYLKQVLKDGDKIAVYNTESGAEALDLGTAKLGDLTLCGTTLTIISTGGISQCNVLSGSTCSISGNIDTAHVYDTATVTFVNNVAELVATAEYEDFNSNIGCGGTVGYLHIYSLNAPRTFYNLYNFDSNTLDISDGRLKTDASHYDTEAPAATPQPTETPTAAAAENTASTPAASDEYDDVPKTGEGNLIFWLFAISALSFTGSCVLRKRTS